MSRTEDDAYADITHTYLTVMTFQMCFFGGHKLMVVVIVVVVVEDVVVTLAERGGLIPGANAHESLFPI